MVLTGKLRVVFRLVKSNNIIINTAEEFSTEASKVCCIINLPFLRWWDNRAMVCQRHSIHLGNSWYLLCETLFEVKWSLFFRIIWNIERSWTFSCSILFSSKHLCAITQVQRATKMSVVFVRNFVMKKKRCFSVLLARYGSMKNVSLGYPC